MNATPANLERLAFYTRHSHEMTLMQFRVLMALLCRADKTTGECYPGTEAIAKDIGSPNNVRAVKQALADLQNMGFVETVSTTRGGSGIKAVRRLLMQKKECVNHSPFINETVSESSTVYEHKNGERFEQKTVSDSRKNGERFKQKGCSIHSPEPILTQITQQQPNRHRAAAADNVSDAPMPTDAAAAELAAECRRRGLDEGTIAKAVGIYPPARVRDALRAFDAKKAAEPIRNPGGLFLHILAHGFTPPQPQTTRGYDAATTRPAAPPPIDAAALIAQDRAKQAAVYAAAEKNAPQPKSKGIANGTENRYRKLPQVPDSTAVNRVTP